jgi:hypothetical protein
LSGLLQANLAYGQFGAKSQAQVAEAVAGMPSMSS